MKAQSFNGIVSVHKLDKVHPSQIKMMYGILKSIAVLKEKMQVMALAPPSALCKM